MQLLVLIACGLLYNRKLHPATESYQEGGRTGRGGILSNEEGFAALPSGPAEDYKDRPCVSGRCLGGIEAPCIHTEVLILLHSVPASLDGQSVTLLRLLRGYRV